MLNQEQNRRIKQALTETHGLIAKELRYSPDLQKPEYLARLRAHSARLQSMLDKSVLDFDPYQGLTVTA